VMEAVAALPAVAENLVVLHPADHMLHPRTHLAVCGVVVLLARQQGCGSVGVIPVALGPDEVAAGQGRMLWLLHFAAVLPLAAPTGHRFRSSIRRFSYGPRSPAVWRV
jgi:hypothetical protein